MTEANLYDLLLVALLAGPAELPPGDYPPGLRDAAIRFAVAAEMCTPQASWRDWSFPASACWVRGNLYVLSLPPESDLDRMPPLAVVTLMLDHNRRFQELCDAWWYIRPDCRDAIGLAKAENGRLYNGWCLLHGAHTSTGRARRALLGEFRAALPEFFWSPSLMPACPYWRVRP
jgi:hypothetical protein